MPVVTRRQPIAAHARVLNLYGVSAMGFVLFESFHRLKPWRSSLIATEMATATSWDCLREPEVERYIPLFPDRRHDILRTCLKFSNRHDWLSPYFFRDYTHIGAEYIVDAYFRARAMRDQYEQTVYSATFYVITPLTIFSHVYINM